jgi:hypothetical protein
MLDKSSYSTNTRHVSSRFSSAKFCDLPTQQRQRRNQQRQRRNQQRQRRAKFCDLPTQQRQRRNQPKPTASKSRKVLQIGLQ